MQQTFQRAVVEKFIYGNPFASSREFPAVGEVHDFLLSDIPVRTLGRGMIAKEAALDQTLRSNAKDSIRLLSAGEWAKRRPV